MFRSLYSEIPKDAKSLEAHVCALETMANASQHQSLFDHLYGCLSILDSKSSSLLSFNSIIIAVFAIFMTRELTLVGWMLVDIGMASILASCFLLLSVVWVHWSTTDHLIDFKAHALTLLNVRRDRTLRYRLAWYLAVAALFLLALFLLSRVFSRAFGT